MNRTGTLLFAVVLAAACNRKEVPLVPTDAGTTMGPKEIPGLMELTIDPGQVRIVVDDVAAVRTQTFTATGRFEDGTRDVTNDVEWTIEDDNVGTMAGGVVTLSGSGGTTRVLARSGTFEAAASLMVAIDLVVIDPTAPADAASRFPEDTSGDDVQEDRPVIIYPATETMFPTNVDNIRHAWTWDDDDSLFEVRFDSNVARVRYYTTKKSFTLEGTARQWLARTHAGRSVQFTVRAVQEDSSTVSRSEPVSLFYSQSEVIGALYYWSTGVKGIMRATLASPSATKFFPSTESGDDKCVSCHTVSRDGRRISAAYDGENLILANIPDRERLAPPSGTDVDYGWGTFDPGATRLLFASKGKITLMDADTGAAAAEVELPQDTFVTHPDWSPDGAWVAVALTTEAPKNKEVTGSSLARLSVRADGTFGAPEIIVQSSGQDDSIYFPSHSPDSRWIAFVRGVGKSKDNVTSKLYIVRADGSAPPIELERLNRVVGTRLDVENIGNAMPTWAPSTRPETNWLAFSSVRAYADVSYETNRDQLWAAAIDLDMAAAGQDPSRPAFWLPFQALDEGNHRAFWALDTEEECPSTIEICDSLDNDCDGIVDEGCCVPEPQEICGDTRDNDCDGAIDEACGCDSTEDCSNGLDDDCDTLIDSADEDCAL